MSRLDPGLRRDDSKQGANWPPFERDRSTRADARRSHRLCSVCAGHVRKRRAPACGASPRSPRAAIAGRAAAGAPAWLRCDRYGGARMRAYRRTARAATTARSARLLLSLPSSTDRTTSGPPPARPQTGRVRRAGLRVVSSERILRSVLLGIELTCRIGVATNLNLAKALDRHLALATSAPRSPAARLIDPVLRFAQRPRHRFCWQAEPPSTREGCRRSTSAGFCCVQRDHGCSDGARRPAPRQPSLTGRTLDRVYLHGLFEPAAR